MKKRLLFGIVFCLLIFTFGCKKEETSDKTVGLGIEKPAESDTEKPVKSDTDKTAEEIINEGLNELEKKTEEILEKVNNTDFSNLTLDTSDYDFYNRNEDENEKYYPAFSNDFDDYSRYSYSGLNEVPEIPRKYKDMGNAIAEADRNNEKYLYKGRKEDLFTSGKSIDMYDSAPNRYIFGYCRPSKEVLNRTLENNSEIPEKFKKIFKDQINEWMDNNPGLDLTLLNENLYTLKVIECSATEIKKQALSLNALACYLKEENIIYVEENHEMNDYFRALVRHEFGHAARTYMNKENGEIHIMASYYSTVYPSLFADESLVTLFTSYKNDAGVYPLMVNCYRILIDSCNYTFCDYINHSSYELRDKVNFYLGDIINADELLLGLENVGNFIYDPIEKAKKDITAEDVKNVLKQIIKICIKKNPEITAKEVFEMLNKDIKDHQKYNDFLTESIIKELFENN